MLIYENILCSKFLYILFLLNNNIYQNILTHYRIILSNIINLKYYEIIF